MLHLLLSTVLQSTPAPTVKATTIPLPSVCIHAGRCGECYNTGQAGIRSADNFDCNPCQVTKPATTIAWRLITPAWKPKKLAPSDYQPPDKGGPGTSYGSGTRWS